MSTFSNDDQESKSISESGSLHESTSLTHENATMKQSNSTRNVGNTSTSSSSSSAAAALTTRSRGNFPPTLYKILSMNYIGIITWLPDGESFRIHSRWKLEKDVLPHYFKHKNFSSFQRQLSIYDFTHTPQSLAHESSYSHRYFKKGREDLVKFIIRNPTKAAQAITSISTDSMSLIEDDSSDDGIDQVAINSISKPSKTTIDMKPTLSSYSSIEKKESNYSTQANHHSTHILSHSPGSNLLYDISDSGSVPGSTTIQSSFVPLPVMMRGQDQTYHQVYQLLEPVPPVPPSSSSSAAAGAATAVAAGAYSTNTNSSMIKAPINTYPYSQQNTRQGPPLLLYTTNEQSLLHSVTQEVTPPTTATTTATTTTAASNSPVYIKDLSSVIGNIVNDVLSTHTQNLQYSQSTSSSSTTTAAATAATTTLSENNSNTDNYLSVYNTIQSQKSPSSSYITSNNNNNNFTPYHSMIRNTYSHDHMSHTHDSRPTATTTGSSSYIGNQQEYVTAVHTQNTSAISTAASSPVYAINLSALSNTLNQHISELFTNLSQQYSQLSISQWQQLYFDVMNAVNQSIVGYIQNYTTTYMTSDNQDHSIEYIDPIMNFNDQPYTQYTSGVNTTNISQSSYYPHTQSGTDSGTNYTDSSSNYYKNQMIPYDTSSPPYYTSAYPHLYNINTSTTTSTTTPTNTTPMVSVPSTDSEDISGVRSTYVQSNTTSNNMRPSSNNRKTTTTVLTPPSIINNMNHQSGGVGVTTSMIPINYSTPSHYTTNTVNMGNIGNNMYFQSNNHPYYSQSNSMPMTSNSSNLTSSNTNIHITSSNTPSSTSRTSSSNDSKPL